VQRERAVGLAELVLRNLHDGQQDWPLSLVTEVYLFGSFARGALSPHDLDIDVEHENDDEWCSHFVTSLAYGRDPDALMRQLLATGKRGCQFDFNFREQADSELTLTWQRCAWLTARGGRRALRTGMHDGDMMRVNSHMTWRARQILRRWMTGQPSTDLARTVEFPGIDQPMLVVSFPGGGHLSIEFTDEAPDDEQPRLGAWLELRSDDPLPCSKRRSRQDLLRSSTRAIRTTS
jgi:hypothetical protein